MASLAIFLGGCVAGQTGSKTPDCGAGSTFDALSRTCSSTGSSDGNGGRVDATIYEDSGYNTLDLPVVYVANRLAETCRILTVDSGLENIAPYAPTCRCANGICRVTVYPVRDFDGMTGISYNLSNSKGTSGNYNMFINVISVDDNPSNGTTTIAIDEDADEIIYLNYNDNDDYVAQASSCSIDYYAELTEVSSCACYAGVCSVVVKYSGVVDPAGGTYHYGAQLRYKVSFPDGNSTVKSYVNVRVLGVDDPPYNNVSTVETSIAAQDEDFTKSVTLSFTDPDGLDTSYTCSVSDLVGLTAGACSCLLGVCTVNISGEANYFTEGTSNTASFKYKITSASGKVSVPRYINGVAGTDEAVEITIKSVNDIPTFSTIKYNGNSYVCNSAAATNVMNGLENVPMVITMVADEGGGTNEDAQALKLSATIALASTPTVLDSTIIDSERGGVGIKYGETDLGYNGLDSVLIPNSSNDASSSSVTLTLTPKTGASNTTVVVSLVGVDDGSTSANSVTCNLYVNFVEVDDPPTVLKNSAVLPDRETNEGDSIRITGIKIDEGGGSVEDPQGVFVSLLTDNKSLLPASNIELYKDGSSASVIYWWADVAYSNNITCCGGAACTGAGSPPAVAAGAENCVYYDNTAGFQTCYRSDEDFVWKETPCINSYTAGGCISGASTVACRGDSSPSGAITPRAIGVLYYEITNNRCWISSGLDDLSWTETGCGRKFLVDTYVAIGGASIGLAEFRVDINPVDNISGVANINIHAQDYTTDALLAVNSLATSFNNGEFKLTVHSIGAIHKGWTDLKAMGAKYSFDRELLSEPYVQLGWEPFLLVGSGNNSSVTIAGYKIYRRMAGEDYNFVNGALNESSIVASTTYTYKDEDFNSVSEDDKGQVYYYTVRPIDSVRSLPAPTNEIFSEIRVILPPKNRVFVHRWIVNKEICGLLHKESDGTSNFRCEYYGPGSGRDNGYYDIGQDMIVDAFEAGCPYTSAHDSYGACGYNGCIGIGNPNSTEPFDADDKADGYVYYDRSSGKCYVYDSSLAANNWVEASAVTQALWESGVANNTDNAHLAPLTYVSRGSANSICTYKDELSFEYADSSNVDKNSPLITPRIPTRREQIAYSSWDSGYSDAEISNMEAGLALASTSKCNTTEASGLIDWYTDTQLPLSEYFVTLPGTEASEIRSVITGSDETKLCVSKYGVQDFIGNVGEWASDVVTCAVGDTCTIASNPAGDYADAADPVPFTYAFNGITGPCVDIDLDGTCDSPINGWTLYEKKNNATYFILPMGLPAVGDYISSNPTSESGKSMLQIGNSSGISTSALHNDYIDIGSSTLLAGPYDGDLSVGGSYKSGDRAGRYFMAAIPRSGTDTESAATLTIRDVLYTAVETGNSGNSIKVGYSSCGTAGCIPSVTVSSQEITINIDNGVTTAGTIVTLVNGDASASALVVASVVGGASTMAQSLTTSVSLTGGMSAVATTIGDIGFSVDTENSVSVVFIPGSTLNSSRVTISGTAYLIVVTIVDGVTLAQEIVDSINNTALVSAELTASLVGSNVAQHISGSRLVGGVSASATIGGMTFTSTNSTDSVCTMMITGAEADAWNVNTVALAVACNPSDAVAAIDCPNHQVTVGLCRDAGKYSTYLDVKNAIDSALGATKLFTTTYPAGYTTNSMNPFSVDFATSTSARLTRSGVTYTAGSDYPGSSGDNWSVTYLPAGTGSVNGICDGPANLSLAVANNVCINTTQKALYVVVDSATTTANDINTAIGGIAATAMTATVYAPTMAQTTHDTTIGFGTRAAATIQDLTYTATAAYAGTAGNNIRVEYASGGVGCTASGTNPIRLTVTFVLGTTAAALAAAINVLPCNAYVTATVTGTGATAQTIYAPGYLTGGSSSGDVSVIHGFRCVTPISSSIIDPDNYSDKYHTYDY